MEIPQQQQPLYENEYVYAVKQHSIAIEFTLGKLDTTRLKI